MAKKLKATKATGKLGILLPGMGAVATTTIAGVYAVNKGLSSPIGSLTQMGRLRVGRRDKVNKPLIKDLVPVQDLKKVVFGGWDVFADNVYEAASNAAVLEQNLLDSLKAPLSKIKPMKAVFDKEYVKKLNGRHVKSGKTKMLLAKALMRDIKNFKAANKCDRLVMVWCGSTEIYIEESSVHKSIAAFEAGLEKNHKDIPPSMIYAYAAIKMGVPYANGAPNLSCDVPALVQLAKENGVPIMGKDFKTGQTLMKTILAPGLKARALGIEGWFSTNILGNRDGEVLDDPDNFKTKEVSKLGVLEQILEPKMYPELYKDLYHKVRINYYPPRGDAKEGWDNIDIRGWLNYPMQIKVDFLCRDSILAAPIVLDLALFLDLAKRADMSGVQEWLGFYLKSPQTHNGLVPIHDIFKQQIKLENTLRYIAGEDLLDHLGLDYDTDKAALPAAPAPVTVAPKRRGRKPGSKNSTAAKSATTRKPRAKKVTKAKAAAKPAAKTTAVRSTAKKAAAAKPATKTTRATKAKTTVRKPRVKAAATKTTATKTTSTRKPRVKAVAKKATTARKTTAKTTTRKSTTKPATKATTTRKTTAKTAAKTTTTRKATAKRTTAKAKTTTKPAAKTARTTKARTTTAKSTTTRKPRAKKTTTKRTTKK